MKPLFVVLLTILLMVLSHAEWAKLTDSTVVKVRGKKEDQVAILRSDGTKEIIPSSDVTGYLQAPAAARIVDDVMQKIGDRTQHDFVRTKLNQIGMAAVPHLLFHLRSEDLNARRSAIAGLQMAWAPEAQEPIKDLLTDKDAYIKSMALRLIQTRFSAADRAQTLAPYAKIDGPPKLAGPALAGLLRSAPNAKTMLAAMEKPALWQYLHPLLPRYHSRKFTPVSIRLLAHADPEFQASAIISLIYQMDHAESTCDAIVQRLSHQSGRLRELAAEYLRWHGTPNEQAALVKQAAIESDPHAKATQETALQAIARRTPDPASLELLNESPFEPYYLYGTALRPDPIATQRLARLHQTFGYPHLQKPLPPKTRPAVPIAQSLMPPLRDYFDPNRDSFGILIPSGNGPFANSHHVADDISFGKQQTTIVAIGDGLVQIAESGTPSWGGLIIIEHTLTDGSTFCSLYGHLGPLIEVKPGQVVKRGTMLGTLGRDHCLATGGYLSHLHFGIHQGPFEPENGERWITGYLPPEIFKEKKHGWVDPQEFLQKHR